MLLTLWERADSRSLWWNTKAYTEPLVCASLCLKVVANQALTNQ